MKEDTRKYVKNKLREGVEETERLIVQYRGKITEFRDALKLLEDDVVLMRKALEELKE